ncbi:50S ribosomal protein L22 [Candidatus Beckwithbacteria bacterium RBG_13_35_6]|uniref:Large ribosomal subunit protein uL22 n=1 Tax=Candidatus Beckwithbacteria bacterium RBG_13_35_6 TaxID=1797456 RepID=A0A1F5DFF6_9BACT|nr:MAG: 50S ribosomal protein L22 [Candidatus Beckwithbacteria bacterium RBG_13_35_6]
MLIRAKQKYIRITPRKVRLIAKAIKSLTPVEALDYLKFINKKAALPLAKTIKQALANAENNLKLAKQELKFNKIDIQEGAVYKRWRPVSRGRAHSILKRTCHIEVVLESKDKQKLEVKSGEKEAIKEAKPKTMLKAKASKGKQSSRLLSRLKLKRKK